MCIHKEQSFLIQQVITPFRFWPLSPRWRFISCSARIHSIHSFSLELREIRKKKNEESLCASSYYERTFGLQAKSHTGPINPL